jgi:hypothetical protein
MGVLLEFLIETGGMFLGVMALFMVVGLTLVLLGALGMLIFAGLINFGNRRFFEG